MMLAVSLFGHEARFSTYLLVLSLEVINEVVDKAVIEVLSTKMGVTRGALNLEDTLLDSQQRNIEGTTTQVEDEHIALTLSILVKTVGDGSSGRLVDDTENVETGNQTSVLGGLALGVTEVGGDGNNSVVDGTTQVSLSSLTHLDQNHRGDFFGSELLLFALEFNIDDGLASLLGDLEGEVLHIGLNLSIVETTANETLSIEDSVERVHGDLVLGSITDQTLGVGESNERGGSTVTLVVGDDFNAIISENTDTGVSGTQVNTDGGSHGESRR